MHDHNPNMPYKTLRSLPESVRDNLPQHAQEIYKEAFNSAFTQYKKEETAHRVALSAVKKKYHKNLKGKWIKT